MEATQLPNAHTYLSKYLSLSNFPFISGVDILDLPTKRLPWTAVATLLKDERLPIDYNRRYQILLRRAQGLGTSVLDCSAVSNSSDYLPSRNSGNDSGGLSVRERQIQLVDRLIDGYVVCVFNVDVMTHSFFL